ncbi:alpha/beta hydrolase [Nocardia asiatica]|uniref:alpha/beta hydrolase n=1 Tax=Nocardia asiatica TaxID=209252 RepID=UPI003EDEF439
MKREVEFTTEDGTVLRGALHSPSSTPAPTIVMAHGFSGTRDHIDHYAAAFAEAGFTAIVYDHRGFGDSEGSPRVEVDPYQQMSDWRDVITHAADLDEVDPTPGFGIWGSSFAGGLAIVIAANDPRVSVVVAQIPLLGAHLNSRQMFTPAQRAELLRRLDEDRRNRLKGAAPALIPVYTTDPDELVALPPVTTQEFIDGSLSRPTWRNEVTLRSVQYLLEWEPAGWIPHVAPKPLLVIVGASDDTTFAELQLDALQAAREPRRVVVHSGGHYDTYFEHFAEAGGAAVDWFKEHLRFTPSEPHSPEEFSGQHAVGPADSFASVGDVSRGES